MSASQHSRPQGRPQGENPRPARAPWEPPTLVDVGSLTEVVQFFGKSGSASDADPSVTTKNPNFG